MISFTTERFGLGIVFTGHSDNGCLLYNDKVLRMTRNEDVIAIVFDEAHIKSV